MKKNKDKTQPETAELSPQDAGVIPYAEAYPAQQQGFQPALQDYPLQEMPPAQPEDKKSRKTKGNKGAAASGVTFKKSARGYKPAEVDEYIENLHAALANAQRVIDEKSEEFKSAYALVSRERDNLAQELSQVKEKLALTAGQLTQALEKIESTAELERQNEKMTEQLRSMYTKLEACKTLITENQQMKSLVGELEATADIERQHALKNEEEIAELRELNKKQAYEFAAREKQLEADFTQEKLRVAQLLKMHKYHIERSGEALREFSAQFTEAKKCLDEMKLE
ncbi:MAG TPA: DivIVA domain-containing protein [Clostridiales bacterium]|nr:MAG: hypothetical protein BWY37_01310 [Firmicutes bacterium ADurb.Bin262]HOU11016.1 DivIVA domain-containing protein [Clostridiales bacterium]HQK74087.1 DivIVA domain-containing protein [Clostridiales bacterium]